MSPIPMLQTTLHYSNGGIPQFVVLPADLGDPHGPSLSALTNLLRGHKVKLSLQVVKVCVPRIMIIHGYSLECLTCPPEGGTQSRSLRGEEPFLSFATFQVLPGPEWRIISGFKYVSFM